MSPEAEHDLGAVAEWIIDQSGYVRTASNYVRRIRAYLNGLKNFPHRGTLREDLDPGIRLIGFERRVTIAFTVSDDTVLIVRIFYGGRDIDELSTELDG
jgi:plasmid stabilization system protein ParE